MQYSILIGRCFLVAVGATVAIGLVTAVSAARLQSPSYEIDTNIGGNFSGRTSSSSYQMESIGGEAIVGNGAGGSYMLTQDASSASPAASLEVSLPAAGVALGVVNSGVSQSADFDIGVQSTSAYSLSIEQDGNLQTAGGVQSIPAIAGTTAAPEAWSEGTTIGLGYSVVAAPLLASKWGSGANFAALPSPAIAFYDGASGTHTISMRLRLGVTPQQVAGTYTNLVTVSGVTTP